MKRYKLIPLHAAITSIALTGAAAAAPASQDLHPTKAYVGQEMAGQAHVTIQVARTIALKARPGQITDQELEKEGGGSGLRYSFDIKSSGKTYEVGIDARSGKVLENTAEGAHPD